MYRCEYSVRMTMSNVDDNSNRRVLNGHCDDNYNNENNNSDADNGGSNCSIYSTIVINNSFEESSHNGQPTGKGCRWKHRSISIAFQTVHRLLHPDGHPRRLVGVSIALKQPRQRNSQRIFQATNPDREVGWSREKWCVVYGTVRNTGGGTTAALWQSRF